jgi:hypothetical protein
VLLGNFKLKAAARTLYRDHHKSNLLNETEGLHPSPLASAASTAIEKAMKRTNVGTGSIPRRSYRS